MENKNADHEKRSGLRVDGYAKAIAIGREIKRRISESLQCHAGANHKVYKNLFFFIVFFMELLMGEFN